MDRLPLTVRSRYGATAVLILAAALLFSHPYTGVRHDGTLYAGEALVRLLPGQFHDDLYFHFGSQGRFTLLPAVYAALIWLFGLGTGTIVGMLAAFALYLAASLYLIRWIVPQTLRPAAMLAVLLGWTLYGGVRIFGYSEPFLTARSFAEPAVLCALGLMLRGHRIRAAAMLAVGLVVHPLIAAGGVLVAWLVLVADDRRWLFAFAAGLIALLALGAAAIGPFDDVFARYDAQWLALVHEANGHAFVLRWSWFDYGILVFDAVVLWFAYRCTEREALRRFVASAAIVGIGCTLVSLVLVDLLLNPFFGKLQIWRAQWVMQWVAMACLPLVLTALWRRGEHGRVSALLLAIGCVAPFTATPGILAAFAFCIEGFSKRFSLSRTTTWIVGAVLVVAAASIAVQYEARVIRFGLLLDQSLRQVLGQALAMNLLLMVAALLFLWAAPRWGRGAPIVAGLVFVAALGVWDQRSAWTRKLEGYRPGTHIWRGLIEADAKVYWYRDLIAPWVLLGHGNYYTQQQGSGAVFSRDMVVELDRRRQVTAILDLQEQICRMMNNLTEKQTSCEPDAAAVKTICNEGALDYVVLQSTLEGAAPLADFSTGVVENGYEKKFFLYRCSALKQGS